ncbi:hypothetical protein FRC10_006251 [Ceratobasidium sp. 414]|nr:hypothetical protein FRC10_006251 [Ceratobasidium sp. 414]
MIYYDILRHPPGDPPTGSGDIPAWDELEPVLGALPCLEDCTLTEPGIADTLAPDLRSDPALDAILSYCPSDVAGNTFPCGADGDTFPHQELALDWLDALVPPIGPGSVGPFPPTDDWGGPYPAVDCVHPPTPDDYAALWAYLDLPPSPPHSPDPPDLPDSIALATSPGAGIVNSGFDQAVCVPDLLLPPPPPPDSPPALSPASSDSSGSESSSGDEEAFAYPLFPSPSSESPAPVPASPHLPLVPSPPTSREEALEIKAEIDAYVDSLAILRKHRGSGPSLVKLKCPWCKKTDRRPSELKCQGIKWRSTR